MRDFLRRNSSTILTCIGAIGVVATSVMAVKATPKALSLIDKAEDDKGEKLSKWETVKVAGPSYIPTIITGAATIACIFGSNIISKHQQATLMSAYALLDNSYKEYKKKVDELYGEEVGEQVRAEIAKDKYTGDGVLEDDDKELFFDFYSGEYFESTKEDVLWAEYELNKKIVVNGCASLNEFYALLGIKRRPEYELVGWSAAQVYDMYWHSWVEFHHEETIIDDESVGHGGLECTIIHMPMEPFIDYTEY